MVAVQAWFDYGRTMRDSPSFVSVAALIGDPARATMLNALMGGEALTATELAGCANVTKQTASSHLHKLVEAGLLAKASQGRHRYFRLATEEVAAMLEAIMGVAQSTRAARARPGPRDPALRLARRCYDHLAGELAVAAYDGLVGRGFVSLSEGHDRASDDSQNLSLGLTEEGAAFFAALGVEVPAGPRGRSRRPLCRPCLDWSARRYHLAGSLGKAILEFCYRKRWARQVPESRVVRFTAAGEKHFRDAFVL